jgi:Protein of unknown function (DUF3293)
MGTDTTIDPRTIQAYRETDYRVAGERPFTLHVGIQSPQLLSEFDVRDVRTGAFITAFNPYSIALGEEDNELRDRNLLLLLMAKGFQSTPGIGVHPSNDWLGEKSQMVWGITRQDAMEIATSFQQNAFIWTGEDGTPELIICR